LSHKRRSTVRNIRFTLTPRLIYYLSARFVILINRCRPNQMKDWFNFMKTTLKNYKSRSGKNHYRWNNGRTKHKDGYVLILMPEHPKAIGGRYVLEHRIVVEKSLGRYLKTDEIVHHRNGIKDDNRIENLELMSRAEHTSKTTRGGRFVMVRGKRRFIPPQLLFDF